jgi:hypothetical protein
MLSVNGVRSLIDCDEDTVLRLVEEGRIAWAFDVALDPMGKTKELRMLPAAVAAFMKGQTCSLTPPQVLSLVLPHDGPEMATKDIARTLNVGNTHVFSLVKRGELSPIGRWRRGPGGSARFSIQTLVSFLERRHYP